MELEAFFLRQISDMVYRARAIILSSLLCMAVISPMSFAIDNPDNPDIVAEFQARCEKFELRVQEQGGNTQDTRLAFSQYEKFLDQELNGAYLGLLRQTSGGAKQDLVRSQRRWLQFRDAEFLFISSNWNVDNFGTSSAVSRGAYRASIVKDRVLGLLHYLKNYPAIAK
jgi:uncharacterized protein YecT (DUF1311 family)